MFFVKNDIAQNDNVYVVGIGASAGGLEAINELLDNISDTEHIAFVVVQHLSSDYKSLLVELLSKHTSMPVEEAHHQQLVEKGKVYVIPNNKELIIKNGHLILTEKEFDKGPNTAIDTFFQSLAHDQRNYAIAVLLSGTGTDGTKGIEAIKGYGGFVIVQDPETAKFDGMPKNAIASGYCDLILPPYDAYNQIGNYIDGVLPAKTAQSKKLNEAIHSILLTVHRKTGYDFMQYKYPTILRRITRRRQMVKLENIEDYDNYIKTSESEPAQLAKEFFIGVTSFFRDKDAFTSLYNEVILKLAENKEEHESFKVWVSACSTGQEAYTITFLIDKALRHLKKVLDVKIFASDIDKSAIEIASKGKYYRNHLLGLDKSILEEYFTEAEDHLCVIPRIRKQIVFATHDILKDPPFIRNDLVTCRNLLIYLNPPLQENVLSTLNFSLNPGGYLFLGTSENPAMARRGFLEVDNKWKIYRRNFEQNNATKRPIVSARDRYTTIPPVVSNKIKVDSQLAEDFKKVLADNLGYAGIYVNENYDIKEGIGDFKRYLSLPDKLNTLNILKMAPPELSGVLSSALRRCLKEKKKQTAKNVKLSNGKHELIDIFVYPPQETATGVYMLVVFASYVIETGHAPAPVQNINLLQKDQYVQQLEDELRETRTNLQMAVEGLETANEELQSSNEELQSANEELQSSNEELQSLNEELHTLNTEHQIRIKELVELNDDLNNYLQTNLIGQIFLDKKLRIRRFNRAAASVINIIDNDIGRPIDHITHHIKSSTFLEDIKKANTTGAVIEREIELNNGKVYLIRVLPYLRRDNAQDGLVITLVDISTTKNLNSLIKSVFDTSANPIFVFESVKNSKGRLTDFICKIANYTAYHSFGRKIREDGLSLKNDFSELATSTLLRKYYAVVKSGSPAFFEFHFGRNESKTWYQARINKFQDGFVMVLSDITDRKAAEEKLKKNYNELLQAKEHLKEFNNQLEQKVRERTHDLKVSEERFRIVASLSNDVIWDWNFVKDSLWWSDTYYELFGHQNNPDLQTHAFRLRHIHPDDKHRVEEALRAVLHGSSNEFNVHYRYLKSDGEYANVLDRGTVLIDEAGTPYRMIGAMVDVTKLEQSTQQLHQKNSELHSLIQQFRFVTDFMPQIVWAARPDGHIDFFNRQWYDFTHFDYEQSINQGWYRVIHSDDSKVSHEAWQHCLQTGDFYETECRLARYDGAYRWFLVRALPMRDEQGSIVKWFGTCTDIQEQKMAERLLEEKVQERTRELKLLNERLESSNVDLLQFASVASHDLKEPLRKIHFFSGLIKDQFPDDANEKLSSYINRIMNASSRATNLINDVLSYSRLSSDNLFEQVNLNLVLQDILQDLELVIQEKGAIINLSNMPIVQAVPGQMRQLFQNIIANSLKFHKPDLAPVITISSKTIERNDYNELKNSRWAVYEIQIKDNGIGFDDRYAKKIFSLFQRLNNKNEYEGTGIGLAIANKIVERHHGVIKANGKEDEGAQFTIVLPERQPNQARLEMGEEKSLIKQYDSINEESNNNSLHR